MFDPLITLLTPDSVQAALESDSSNRTIPAQDELVFSFLGTKGPGDYIILIYQGGDCQGLHCCTAPRGAALSREMLAGGR